MVLFLFLGGDMSLGGERGAGRERWYNIHIFIFLPHLRSLQENQDSSFVHQLYDDMKNTYEWKNLEGMNRQSTEDFLGQ